MPVLPILSLDLKEELIPDDGHMMEFNPRTGECTLSITEATPEDEKVYSVQAVNTFGRAECRANLVLSKFFLHFTCTIFSHVRFRGGKKEALKFL